MEFALPRITRFAGDCSGESWLAITKAAGSEGQRHERAGGLDRVPALGQPAGKLLDGPLDHAMHDFLRVHLGRARPIPGKPLPMGARGLKGRAGLGIAREGFEAERHVGSQSLCSRTQASGGKVARRAP